MSTCHCYYVVVSVVVKCCRTFCMLHRFSSGYVLKTKDSVKCKRVEKCELRLFVKWQVDENIITEIAEGKMDPAKARLLKVKTEYLYFLCSTAVRLGKSFFLNHRIDRKLLPIRVVCLSFCT